MIVSRRKYDALLQELARLEVERDEGRRVRRELVTDLREAHESLKQITDHDGRLTALLQTTQRDQGAEVARLEGRLERAVRGCARYRGELDDRDRVIDQLTVQLMGAMGYSRDELVALGIVDAAQGSEPGLEVAS
ncbi:hypothetical protein IPZ58_07805 [Streptomyces roseoverticillatus]|uniref:hypothetical protein n=1 Tax=Streptomyces roseoverticillatus TaxID=66429 RepID=UPI001F25B65B|nr:hypothetical protein [Streptomyces roseoverticillatus]MCF3101483.1 hypothetical protein [Streptomyces roseoverticillatus]